ncbi:cupin domain-containing protein [Aurantiacibacter gilvus]|uniref:Cupin domain-containing protein n=1 Tax=Aurantiacibacter gilvus TaxID=3139141 RepID=A0ABU9IJE5_9SPHN
MARSGLRATVTKRRLDEHWIHLGLGATAEPQPPFDGMEWYADYGARNAADGTEGRLVSQYRFTEDWPMWEMHPEGAEVVVCTAGSLTLIQEIDGEELRNTITPGEYVINPPGVWHTADITGEGEALFITAGAGTQHRPR